MNALLKEISIRRDYLEGEKIQTVYFGGGTPSLLTESELGRIMETFHTEFAITPDAEITLEANPDDINPQKLSGWKTTGINRLSTGIQSFFEEDLAWMNRAHNAAQAVDCIRMAQDAGFFNMSIDLIYGTPGLTDEKWQQNMKVAADSGIPHLSCYALTVEPGTALDAMTRTKKVASVNTDDQARQFLMMTDYLQSNGYEHYEISNFALPGSRSRHNSSYWSGEKYLGLGPSAHSFNGASRQWNVSNNALYIQSVENGKGSFETETLTAQQQLNEYIMTSVRTMEGMDLNLVKTKFGEEDASRIESAAVGYFHKGWLEHRAERLVLTREGKLFADGVAAGLFVDP